MSDLLSYLPSILSGVFITVVLTISALAIGLVLAVLMAMAAQSPIFILSKTVALIGFFFRGTPLLVQFFLIYYGLGQFDWMRESWLWPLLREPLSCAILTLSLNSACYTTVLLQGAIRSVPRNEVIACEALGMSKWLAFRRIIFPHALKLALPGFSNEVIMLLKATSLASTITLLELMGVTQQLIADTYNTLTFYCIAGVLYLILNGVIYGVFHLLYKWNRIPT